MTREEQLQGMLSAYLDGELTQADEQRVRIFLEDSDDARRRYDELCKLREITASMAFAPPPDDRLDRIERSPSVRTPLRVGWFLLVICILGLSALGVHTFLTADRWTIGRILVGGFSLGLLLLLGSVGRQRWLEWPYDRYRGVKR